MAAAPAGVAGAGSGAKGTASGAGQAESARSDDVPLDLARATFDGVGGGAEVLIFVTAERLGIDPFRLRVELTVEAKDLHRGAGDALIEFGAVELRDAGFVPGGDAFLRLDRNDLEA